MNTKRLIIDVREPFEYAAGHVEGAINISPADLMAGASQLNGVDKDTELVLYCRSGSRSNASIPYFEQLGFTNITNGISGDNVAKNYA